MTLTRFQIGDKVLMRRPPNFRKSNVFLDLTGGLFDPRPDPTEEVTLSTQEMVDELNKSEFKEKP